MRRFFTHLKPLLAILSFVVVFCVVPQITNAAGILPDWMDTGSSIFGSIVSSPIEIFILPLASFIMYLGGQLMDFAITFGLNTAYIFSLSPAINLGWVIVRDICNIFFIFVLIYISLGTIVQGTSFGTKDLLTKVIIAALLINFSLFATRVVIDVSNIFGNWLYGGVLKTLEVNSKPGAKTSISGLIATRLGVIQFFQGNATENRNNQGSLTDPSKSFTGRVLRLAIVLIAAYIFFYCSVLFISRSITLLFLMVFSPIGFMGGVLPQLKEYASDWKKELTSAAMFPIAFLLMLYIALQFINSLDKLKGAFPAGTADGSDFTIAQYFQYFLIIFLLQACLSVAKDNSGKMGKAMGGLADGLGKLAVSAVTTYATGGISMGLRAVGRGAGAAMSAESGAKGSAFFKTAKENISPMFTDSKISKFIKTGAGKNTKEAIANQMKSGTWDIRNAQIPFVEGSNMGGLLTNAIGATGVKVEGKQSKDIKTETSEWAEERKIEKANQAILKDIDNVLKVKSAGLSALKRAAEAPGSSAAAKTAYATALKVFNDDPDVKDAKGRISDETQKLGNKQLEKLDKGVLKNENFLQTISQSQAEHLADKAETDEDKAKVWGARLSDVTAAVNNNADAKEVRKAIKNHSDKELQNLPADILKNTAFVNPTSMDYDKFDKLMKSDKLTNSTKAKMKEARYKKLDEAIASNIITGPDSIESELKELEENEIAKLGWKDSPTGPDKRLSHPHVIYRLTPKTLGKVLDELSSSERATIKSVIASAPGGLPTNVTENITKVNEWFTNNPVGKTF